MKANPAHTLDGAIPSLFDICHHWPAASDERRSDVASMPLAASPGGGDMFIVPEFNQNLRKLHRSGMPARASAHGAPPELAEIRGEHGCYKHVAPPEQGCHASFGPPNQSRR